MPPREQLRESIDHLREELAEGDPLSESDRALLDRTLAEVATRLDREEHEEEEGGGSLTDSLYEELQELSVRVEQTRPNLSVILGRIAFSLSQLGI